MAPLAVAAADYGRGQRTLESDGLEPIHFTVLSFKQTYNTIYFLEYEYCRTLSLALQPNQTWQKTDFDMFIFQLSKGSICLIKGL